MAEPAAATYGPLYRYAPPRVLTHGDIAAGVGADLGLDMDEQQRWLLDAIFAEDEDELPASPDVAVIGPRQTVGKTATLEVAAITDITVFDVPLHVWTAHEFKTARKAYLDMKGRLDAHPDYADRVTYRDSHGEEAIFFELGGTIEFHARSGGSARGFTTSKITLDEALYLQAGDLGALAPTLVTMPDAQVRYGSSAGKARSEQLRSVRNRGRKPEPDETLAYIEFGAHRRKCALPDCEHAIGTAGCALDDRQLWWQANSGLWVGRVTEGAILKQRRLLAGAPEEFAREFFSWWDEPQAVADRAIAADVWKARRDATSRCADPVALGIEVSPTRQVSLVAAGWRPDGRWHGELITTGRGTGWLIDVLIRVIEKVDPAVLVIDSAGRAASMIADIEAAGFEPTVTSASQRARADRGLVDDLEQDRGRVIPCPPFDSAAECATWRDMPGGGQAFDRRDVKSDISPMVGLSLARHGLLLTAASPSPQPGAPPVSIPTTERSALEREVDLLSTGF